MEKRYNGLKQVNNRKMSNKATQFKKGQSGNPKGRPVGSKDYKTIMWEALEKIANDTGKESAEEIYKEILMKGAISARKGDYRFYKDILDRVHGSAIQKNEHTGKDGEPLVPDRKQEIDEAIQKALENK